jgi:Predicted membrane protein (DUF2306)
MTKKVFWILFVAFAIIIGLYPGMYFLVDRKFALLGLKPEVLLTNVFWNIGFYTHIIFGGIALLIGWAQFSTKIRTRNILLHRRIGKTYLLSAMLSSTAAIYLGFFATGGLVSSLGFISLGIVWFYTTLKAYLFIREKQIEQHQKMMVYSYAACFSAVTLRISQPLLILIYGDFERAYMTVAWLCWVPNLIVAYLIIRRMVAEKIKLATAV